MTHQDNLKDFLISKPGEAFCDDCIAKCLKLSSRQHARDETQLLEGRSPNYSKKRRFCSKCKSKNEKLSISYRYESSMPDNVTNELILDHLKSIQSRLSNLENGQAEMKTALVSIQQHMIGFMTNATAHESAIANIQTRIDRIEKRLELVDNPA